MQQKLTCKYTHSKDTTYLDTWTAWLSTPYTGQRKRTLHTWTLRLHGCPLHTLAKERGHYIPGHLDCMVVHSIHWPKKDDTIYLDTWTAWLSTPYTGCRDRTLRTWTLGLHGCPLNTLVVEKGQYIPGHLDCMVVHSIHWL